MNEQTVAQPQLQPMSSYDGYVEASDDSFADFTHFPEPNSKNHNSNTLEYVTTIKVIDSNASGVAQTQNLSATTNNISQIHQQVVSLPPNSVAPVPPIPQPHPRTTIGTRTSAFEVYRRQPSATTVSGTSHRNSQSPNEVPSSHTSLPTPSSTSVPTTTSLDYEKRLIAISDNLRLVRIRPGETMHDVLKHLKEQNHLLLKLCNDLSEELLEVQAKKENMRLCLDATVITANNNHTNH